jgi:Flp pilus assembly protein TadD
MLDSKRLESYFALGKALYVKGNFVEAAAVYEEAIKVNPQSAAAHNILGLTLDKQGLVEQALLEYRSALNLEPDNAGYHANLVHELALQHSNGETSGEGETVAKLH